MQVTLREGCWVYVQKVAPHAYSGRNVCLMWQCGYGWMMGLRLMSFSSLAYTSSLNCSRWSCVAFITGTLISFETQVSENQKRAFCVSALMDPTWFSDYRIPWGLPSIWRNPCWGQWLFFQYRYEQYDVERQWSPWVPLSGRRWVKKRERGENNHSHTKESKICTKRKRNLKIRKLM